MAEKDIEEKDREKTVSAAQAKRDVVIMAERLALLYHAFVQAMAAELAAARAAYEAVVRFVAENGKADPNAAFAASVPYLMLAGNLMAGWQLARSWLATHDLPADDAAFASAKRATAAFYCAHILPRCGALRDAVLNGGDSVMALPVESF